MYIQALVTSARRFTITSKMVPHMHFIDSAQWENPPAPSWRTQHHFDRSDIRNPELTVFREGRGKEQRVKLPPVRNTHDASVINDSDLSGFHDPVVTVILNKSEVCSIRSSFPCETITFTSFQQILGTAALLIPRRPTPTCYGNYVDDKCFLGESGLKCSDALDWWRKCQRGSTGDDDRLRVGSHQREPLR